MLSSKELAEHFAPPDNQKSEWVLAFVLTKNAGSRPYIRSLEWGRNERRMCFLGSTSTVFQSEETGLGFWGLRLR